MRFGNGWVKHWRSLDDGKHWVSKHAIAYAIFNRLVSWANWEPTKVLRNGEFITVERGSLVTSTRDIANSFSDECCDRKTIEKFLNLFEKDGMIVQQKSHRGRIITICNYSKYQDTDEIHSPLNGPPTGQLPPHCLPTDSPPSGHVLKKLRIKKKFKKGEEGTLAPSALPPEKLVFDTYAEAYEKRYGRRIAYSAAKGRLCRLLIEELGSVENASEAAKTFLTSDRPFHVQRGHSLDVLLKDCDTAYTVSHIRKQN